MIDAIEAGAFCNGRVNLAPGVLERPAPAELPAVARLDVAEIAAIAISALKQSLAVLGPNRSDLVD